MNCRIKDSRPRIFGRRAKNFLNSKLVSMPLICKSMIKKNRNPITCTKAPRRSQHYEIRRSVRPQRRQHFRGVCILHIHQLISSTARSSFNNRSQKPRETRKNWSIVNRMLHTRANNFRRRGNNGRTLLASIIRASIILD